MALLTVVTFVELGKSDPLLSLHLLRRPTYRLSSVGLLFVAVVMIGSSYLASMYFQRARDMSAFATGLALLPMGLAALVVALVALSLADALGLGGLYAAGAAVQFIGAGVLATGTGGVPLTIAALTVIGAGLPSCSVPCSASGPRMFALRSRVGSAEHLQ